MLQHGRDSVIFRGTFFVIIIVFFSSWSQQLDFHGGTQEDKRCVSVIIRCLVRSPVTENFLNNTFY